MIELTKKDKEVNITLKYSEPMSGKATIDIFGQGDFGHHLIEGVFELVDRLARMERVGHQADEWRKKNLPVL